MSHSTKNIEAVTAPNLATSPNLRHGFFGRRGGVSSGLYDSLNCGFGSGDDRNCVADNRARAMASLDANDDALLTLYQTHSADVVTLSERPDTDGPPPRADAAVTKLPGLAIGILTADCSPVLLTDPVHGVIGAAHAGWRGAIGGIVERTVEAMVKHGAERSTISAAVGPCIGPASYEVGDDLRDRFTATESANQQYFYAGLRTGHWMFDLPRFVADRCCAAGIADVWVDTHDTLAQADSFFSYRRNTLAGATDYGRNLSAIMIGK